ncbi:MAG: isoaspartyl peptidase/L-asparaginase [Bacteroidetes bacterium]|nr:isoaspartyl peptidase/L-asparaginase [Bacteroidota bacterium]
MLFRRVLALILLVLSGNLSAQNLPRFALVVHGGAGAMGGVTPAQESRYRAGLEKALEAGYALLKEGGTAIEAVRASIRVLEDDSLFNAGKGAVFSYEGRNELDASIMDGKALRAGAVAGVTRVKNPIEAAYAVMEQSPHVMLCGRGADEFAATHGCQMVKPAYFYTTAQRKLLIQARKTLRRQQHQGKSGSAQASKKELKYGTVGAVALDAFGNLAAGTSTGGITAKRWNRIGDSPIIGAGTYASNAGCAVSCTGQGEFFIRLGVAKSLSDQLEIGHKPLQEAAADLIFEKLAAMGGAGGLIAIDRKGNIAMPFNTRGMFRGYVREDGSICTEVFNQ